MSNYLLQVPGNLQLKAAGSDGVEFLSDWSFGTGASESNCRSELGVAIGSDVLAYSADLQAIAGLTSAADKGIQFTGSGTAGLFDLTSAGKALLDDADAGAQRTTLGLGSLATASSVNNDNWSGTDLSVANGGTGSSNAPDARSALGVAIGSQVQAYDAGLQSIAGLTTAANKMIYTTASDTYAVADLTAAGRALLDDADAETQRTTMGVAIGSDVLAYNAPVQSIATAAAAAGEGEDGYVLSWNNGSSTFVLAEDSSASYTAGNGLTLTGSAFSINTAITADLSTAQTLTSKTLEEVVKADYATSDSAGFHTQEAKYLETTDNSTTTLYSNTMGGTTNTDGAIVVRAQVVCRNTDDQSVNAYDILAVVKRDGEENTSEVLMANISESEENSGYACAVSADTTNGGYVIEVNGDAADTCKWVCWVSETACSEDT